MYIRNMHALCADAASADALGIVRAGMDAASPEAALRRVVSRGSVHHGSYHIDLKKYRRICVIAYGKAAGDMAGAVDSITRVSDGIVVIPTGSRVPDLDSRYVIMRSTHPIPSAKSVRAARALLERVSELGPRDYVMFLVSGGGSAMLAAPYMTSLKDKKAANDLLIRSGASIGEINCVRRHISEIKGGGLVRNLKCDGVALIMSDVQGNRARDVSSGCTVSDATTRADAMRVIQKYSLVKSMPASIVSLLRKKEKRVATQRIPNRIIASNADCVRAMIREARRCGYSVNKEESYGDVDAVAQRLVSRLRGPMSCVVFGGEPTVKVRGNGKGGRNQELVARMLLYIRHGGIIAASVGTDGIDGNTRAAGAIAGTDIAPKSEIRSYLRNNDSGSFFERHKRSVVTGYTQTNLQDVGVILRRT